MQELQNRIRKHFNGLRKHVVRKADGFIKYDYCIPGGFYEELWDWDGFFIAAHLSMQPDYGPVFLKNWVLNFLSASDERGYVPGCITPRGLETGHRAFQMKPFIAQGAEHASRLTGDYDWIKECYGKIVKIATLREFSHRDERTGLFFWDTAVQSGADNNPALSNNSYECRNILACDINAFQYREYMALSRIADKTGTTADAEMFGKKAEYLSQAMNKYLWSEDDRSYWNLHKTDGKHIKRITYSNFLPLWAGIANKQQGRGMVKTYLWNEEHMLSPHGLRSLSRKDIEYNNMKIIYPHSNWQGPIWIIANYFYFISLIKYNFDMEARELVIRLAQMCLEDIKSCGSMHENYNAETGEPLSPSIESCGREGCFIGWNLLLEDMILIVEGDPGIFYYD